MMTGARFKKKIHRIAVVASSALLLVSYLTIAIESRSAYAAVWDGRAPRHGYFDNDEDGSNSPYRCAGHVASGPVIDNDCYSRQSIPLSVGDAGTNAARKDEVYNYLRNKYDGGSTWEKTGVSFIVNTMLGRKANNRGADKDKSLDSSEWNDLRDRLDDPKLTVNGQQVSSATWGRIDTYYQYRQHDVAYYYDTETGKALVFRYDGRTVYVLLHKCANPLGDLAGLPKREIIEEDPTWSIKPTASVTASGNTITWTHSVSNNGPDPTDANVVYKWENGDGFPDGSGGAHTYTAGKAKTASPGTFQSTFNYDPVADAGKTFCRATSATPRSGNNSGTVTSNEACYTVNSNYSLTPIATFSGGGTTGKIEPGQSGTVVDYAVRNNGPSGSIPSAWQLTRCYYTPGQAYPEGQGEQTNLTEARFNYGGQCSIADSGTDTYGVQTKNYGPTTEDADGALTGSHICYIMSVNPAGSGTDDWRHSPTACLSVIKTPKIQAWGGDIKAGLIRTSPAATINGKTYGSWAEYGIFNYGSVSGMGSAAVFAGGCTANCLDVTRLTFANTTTQRFMEPADEGYAKAYRNDGGAAIGGSFAGLASGAYTRGGGLAIGGGVPDGLRAVITVTGNLTITSDITYPAAYGSANDVPRVIFVVDGDVIVNDNVKTVDAWLISKGTLFTCDKDIAATRAVLNAGKCSNKLTFNGPVYVNDTRLSRTYGADGTNRDDAAEVFNLRPDIFVSSLAESSRSSAIQTMYEKELPPRW